MGRMPFLDPSVDLDAFRGAVGADLALLIGGRTSSSGRLQVLARSGATDNVPDEILAPPGSLLARVLAGDRGARINRLPLRSAMSGRVRPLGPALVVPVGDATYVVLARRLPSGTFDDGDLDKARSLAAEQAAERGDGLGPREADATFRQAFEAAAVGMSLVDATVRYRWVNQPLCDMLGRPREELIGRGATESVHPEHVERAITFYDRLRNGDAGAVRERLRFQRPDGRAVWADMGGSVVGGVRLEPLILVQQFDVTVEQELTDELAYRAMHDQLTQLANRTLLRDRLQAVLARNRRGGPRAVVFYLDLDGFKGINDTYGHDAGDVVLVEIARRLGSVVRAGDTVARVGGDEFVVAGEAIDVDEATHLARRIGTALRPRIDVGGTAVLVAASIGIALSVESDTPEDLVARADRALLSAKRLTTLHVVSEDGGP